MKNFWVVYVESIIEYRSGMYIKCKIGPSNDPWEIPDATNWGSDSVVNTFLEYCVWKEYTSFHFSGHFGFRDDLVQVQDTLMEQDWKPWRSPI